MTTKSEDYEAPYYRIRHGSSSAALDYDAAERVRNFTDAQIQEFRAGPEGWYELSMRGRLPKLPANDRVLVVDDNFWRGLKVALGFTVVMASLLALVGYRLFS